MFLLLLLLLRALPLRLNDICGGSLHNEGGRRAKSTEKGRWLETGGKHAGQIRWFDAVACGGACGAGAVCRCRCPRPGGVVGSLSLRSLESVKNAAGNAQKRNTKHKRQKTEGG